MNNKEDVVVWVKCAKDGCFGRWNWRIRKSCPLCGYVYNDKPTIDNTKIQSVSSSTWEVKIPYIKDCSKAPESIIIFIQPLVKIKIDYLMKKMDNIEWLAYLIGKDYIVEDLFIPQQEVTGVSVDNIKCNNFNNLNVIGVIHSHHDMSGNFSHTDDEWINQNHDISLVATKQNISGQVRWKTPCGSLKVINAVVKLKMNVKIDFKEFDKVITDNIKRKKIHVSVQGQIFTKEEKEICFDNNDEVFHAIDNINDDPSELDFTEEKTLADELNELEESGMFSTD